MSSDVHLTANGLAIEEEERQYIWVGNIYSGPGVALSHEACAIELPLTTDPLCCLVENIKSTIVHNFVPTIMTMASTVLALHYKTLLQTLKFCTVPLAFGYSGTGKTTAIISGLSIIGAHESNFYSKITKDTILDLYASGGTPVGIDDPQSKNVSATKMSLENLRSESEWKGIWDYAS